MDTKIFGYDHNWSDAPGRHRLDPARGRGRDGVPVPTLLSPQTERYFAGTAFHCYAGDASRQTMLHRAFPGREIWFTECSGSHGPSDPPAQFFSDTLKWHTRNLVLGVTRNWGKTVVNWNLALDPSRRPAPGWLRHLHRGRDGRPRADGDRQRRVPHARAPGPLREARRQRIASTSFGTTGWNGQIMDAAFRNRDGSTALVVHNENDDPRSFAVAQGGHSFEYTLPGGALATFIWPASKALDDDLRAA